MVTMERVAVSLPKELIGKVEELRDNMGLNRSKFYRMALKAYVEEFPEEKDEKIARLYQDIYKTDQELSGHFKRESYKHLPPY